MDECIRIKKNLSNNFFQVKIHFWWFIFKKKNDFGSILTCPSPPPQDLPERDDPQRGVPPRLHGPGRPPFRHRHCPGWLGKNPNLKKKAL